MLIRGESDGNVTELVLTDLVVENSSKDIFISADTWFPGTSIKIKTAPFIIFILQYMRLDSSKDWELYEIIHNHRVWLSGFHYCACSAIYQA